MWPSLSFILFGAVIALHLWWRRRWREAVAEITRHKDYIARSEEDKKQISAQAEAQQRTLFNSMAEGVLLLDAGGRIELANQALKRLMDATDAIRGQTILEAFRVHQLADLVQRVVIEGEVSGFEFELPGTPSRILEVNAALITDRDKRQQGVLLVLHDLSRLKQLESTRKEFVANVSHELKTPLSLIKGYVETLIDGAKDDSAVAGRFLQTILRHTDRLTFLIEDLLTISQLEAGHSVMNLIQLELKPLVDRVLDDLRAKAQEKGSSLTNEVPNGLLVYADADRLQQVLFNLVDNSIKYGRTAGFAKVSANVVANGEVEICVRDDGAGIPSDALERVFERFYRVDRGRSREQGGTGLGLSIVKHIVQSHGGRVWAASKLGEGSSFYFTLCNRR